MKNIAIAEKHVTEPFLTDVKALREQARRQVEKGAVSPTYVGDVARAADPAAPSGDDGDLAAEAQAMLHRIQSAAR